MPSKDSEMMDKGGEAYRKRKIMAICLDEWWDEGIFEM